MEIIDFQNKRWLLKHKRPDEGIDAGMITLMKEYWRSDLVLKKNGVLLFVEEIPEAEFEDIIINREKQDAEQ